MPASPAATTAISALATARHHPGPGPTNQTLIIANIIGTMLPPNTRTERFGLWSAGFTPRQYG